MTADAVSHHRTSGQALAFVGVLGVIHAAWFTWRREPSFIEPPAMWAISALFLVVAMWMVSRKPDVTGAQR
jgi:hypothetical protein